MMEAQFVTVQSDGRVACELCPRHCIIPMGGKGACRVRINRDGKLIASSYGLITAMALDPIEKKPLYHFHPGKPILSIGTTGCNLACSFCQNWRIAHTEAEGTTIFPEELLGIAKRYQSEGNIGVAYTYSEPAIWWEFIRDLAPLIRRAGMKNVIVTNGYLESEPWEEILHCIDAVNIDVKGFTEVFYKKNCKGCLEPVIKSVQLLAGRVHLEVTNLLIPEENDNDDELRELARWLAQIDPQIPLHISRYYPQYKMDRPQTPSQALQRAYEIACEYLDFVYVGNLPGSKQVNTYCPECGELMIERRGFTSRLVGLDQGRCTACGWESSIIM
jgi:pyruvate formate lyase activating enzyme